MRRKIVFIAGKRVQAVEMAVAMGLQLRDYVVISDGEGLHLLQGLEGFICMFVGNWQDVYKDNSLIQVSMRRPYAIFVQAQR